MKIARIYNDGRLAIKGEIIEDGGTRFNEEGNIHINELIEVVDSGIRYIRDWISGSSANPYNHWSGIEAIANGINVALGKEVTTNWRFNSGSLRLVTNGSLEDYTDLGSDPKTYVQIDLGSIYDVSEIKVWHYYLDGRMYYDTKTEVSVDGINWVSIFDSTGIEEMYYPETIEGKTHLVPPIYIDVNYIKIANSNMYVNELIEDKDEWYVMATDDDFSGISNGSFRYMGSDLKVVIPNSIKGIELTRYDNMFRDSSVIGVVSYNKNVTHMAGMFHSSQATSLDLSSFDTSSVTNMSDMFSYSNATILDLSNFNTSNVTNMVGMFYNSQATLLDLSNFNTFNVVDMRYMFYNSQATTLDLSNFDTSSVTNMNGVFYGSKATSLDLSNFNTSKVADMGNMFGSSQATSLDLSNFNTSNVTSMRDMFNRSQATSLDLSNFNTSNVTSMRDMFSISNATTLDLSSFDTSNVTDMVGMFYNSQATSLDLSSFDTSSITNMSYMFYGSKITTLDLSSFDTSKVNEMGNMFQNSQSTIGYARTQADADKFNASSNKPVGLNFVVKP